VFDIEFFQQMHWLKRALYDGQVVTAGGRGLRLNMLNHFERARTKDRPIVYNIETTNACNMKCKMCPRTTRMTRPIKTMEFDDFRRIIDQLTPWTSHQWKKWEQFVTNQYGIKPDDMSENHFYLYIIPQVIQLHGYGAPLLDKVMVERVHYMRTHGLPSYFSCNPANIDVPTFLEMMSAGLDVVKFSIESVSDERHKEIRGNALNFQDAYHKILDLISAKHAHKYRTTIVITMLDLDQPDQEEEYAKLVEKFKDIDVYIYLKSQDQQWYDGSHRQTGSVHWSEICHHPWTSMSVKSDGMVAMCMEDYNNEIILGDALEQRLIDIWNGTAYQGFRMQHFACPSGIKCTDECDMDMIGDFFPRKGNW
jgi:MoaA/NifB/PqqE/SkfB family radical SAM enzyme